MSSTPVWPGRWEGWCAWSWWFPRGRNGAVDDLTSPVRSHRVGTRRSARSRAPADPHGWDKNLRGSAGLRPVRRMLASMSELSQRRARAFELERPGCERASDGNGDVAAGRCRGFDAAVADPAGGMTPPSRGSITGVRHHRGPYGVAGRTGEGDSFVVAFTRASGAVACALAVAAGTAPRSGCASACIPGKCSCVTRQLHRSDRQPDGAAARSGPRRPDRAVGHDPRSGCRPAPADAWLTDLGSHHYVICPGPNGWCSCAIPTFATTSRRCAPRNRCRPASSGSAHEFRGPGARNQRRRRILATTGS